eukprot:TRINITY_DN20299_c0_g1_i1.p1 TRINITY_DN20299_c0_g1~~TRINITY_DN20299_c0_g1_i1.p1  ORF type:complete len:294 (+),score=92.20 TRINITY_DN20299_c0_g1_i1:67-948(+)
MAEDDPPDDAFPFSLGTRCFLPRYLACFDFDVSDADDAAAKRTWYARSARYWAAQPATVEGMILGPGAAAGDGADAAFAADLSGTASFLDDHGCRGGRALDCGAGIGRVAFGALAKRFRTVDLIEPSEAYVQAVRGAGGAPGGGIVFHTALQDVVVAEADDDRRRRSSAGTAKAAVPSGFYDLVLVNWCVAFLTDDDLVEFLKKVVRLLRPSGRVVLKENVAPSYFRARRRSASVARTDEHFCALFAAAGLGVGAERWQGGLCDDWLDVKMYLLSPQPPTAAGVQDAPSDRLV